MKSDQLPESKELKDLKVKLSKRKTKEGYDEALMKGYPDIFPGETSHGSHFVWRIERWMIGHMYHGRWRSGNGWKLVVAMILMTVLIYGGSRAANPFFGYFTLTSLVAFAIAAMFGYFFWDKEIYIGGIEDVKEGELVPVSWEKDETGKRNFQYVQAPFNKTDTFKIPIRSMDFMMLWGVREEDASNHKKTLRFKNHYHNLACGDLLYSDLGTGALTILEPEVTLFPVEIEKALERLQKYARKDQLSDTLTEEISNLVREMYRAARLIDANHREIIDLAGKDFIRVKRNKSTEALFLAWSPSLLKVINKLEMEVQDSKERKGELMQLINNARDIKLHEPDIEVYGQMKFQEGLRKGWTNRASTEISESDIALQIKAQKSIVNAEAKRAIEDETSKAVQAALGNIEDEDEK